MKKDIQYYYKKISSLKQEIDDVLIDMEKEFIKQEPKPRKRRNPKQEYLNKFDKMYKNL